MEEEKKICPQCPKGCLEDALSCGRGKAYFCQTSGQEETGHHHDHHGHHGKGGFKPDMDSLYGLLRMCGHALHHGKADGQSPEAFSALTEQEQAQLKTLLQKLVKSWTEQI